MAKKSNRIFETRYFGLLIGLFLTVFVILIGLTTAIWERLELNMLDLHFRLKNVYGSERIQEGVQQVEAHPRVSDDILIIGVDIPSLARFGRFPFPRYRHADLLNALARIQDQSRRERSVFLDFFFNEPAADPYEDAVLVTAMRENGRVFLETILDVAPPAPGAPVDMFDRHETLYRTAGEITTVHGDWEKIPYNLSVDAPLQPYGASVRGYGHANFDEDYDRVFRRQQLIGKSTVLVDEVLLSELSTEYSLNRDRFERLAWFDREGRERHVPYPLTDAALRTLRSEMAASAPPVGTEDPEFDGTRDFIVRHYRDHFVPAITLSLALDYFNRSFDDLEIRLGEYIRIPAPQYFNVEQNRWEEPYRVRERREQYDSDGEVVRNAVYRELDEIKIPINERGEMMINYMGRRSSASFDGHQTFPVRSYSAYAARSPGIDPSTWPRTLALDNRILMVGAFAPGIADDEKLTPYGLMYGVEIHANALNTIIMSNFIEYAPAWLNYAILFALVMLTAFGASRVSTIWAAVFSLVVVIVLFFTVTIVFDAQSYLLEFSPVAVAVLATFVSIVVYRVMTEERDKRRIRDMFGKYVSPRVVDEILDSPPELGGIDKELSVFFSDIRGFTTLSEAMTPQELVNHLNVYLTAMTDTILEYHGTLDKYVGDEIMCFWGAPLPQEDHAILACKCAIRQMQVLDELNASWPEERRINIGIGINSGIMTVGNMGSLGRMNYTLMGDNVNLGARLEGTNKQYMTNIIISEYTYGLVQDRILAREMDNIRVKGKNRPVGIYELIDVPEGLEPPLPPNEKKRK